MSKDKIKESLSTAIHSDPTKMFPGQTEWIFGKFRVFPVISPKQNMKGGCPEEILTPFNVEATRVNSELHNSFPSLS